MNYTEMLFNRDVRLVDLLNQADIKNLKLIGEINNREDEIERLENIIKEAREYIENHNKVIRENKMLGVYGDFMIIPKELLEILDKENKEWDI